MSFGAATRPLCPLLLLASAALAQAPTIGVLASVDKQSWHSDLVARGWIHLMSVDSTAQSVGFWSTLIVDPTIETSSPYYQEPLYLSIMQPANEVSLQTFLDGFFQQHGGGFSDDYSGYPSWCLPTPLLTSTVERALFTNGTAADNVRKVGDPLFLASSIAQPFAQWTSGWDAETKALWTDLAYDPAEAAPGYNLDGIMQAWIWRKVVQAGLGFMSQDQFFNSETWRVLEKHLYTDASETFIQSFGMRGPDIDPATYAPPGFIPAGLVGYPLTKPKFTTGPRVTIRVSGAGPPAPQVYFKPQASPRRLPIMEVSPGHPAVVMAPGWRWHMQAQLTGIGGAANAIVLTQFSSPGSWSFTVPLLYLHDQQFKIAATRYLIPNTVNYGPWIPTDQPLFFHVN